MVQLSWCTPGTATAAAAKCNHSAVHYAFVTLFTQTFDRHACGFTSQLNNRHCQPNLFDFVVRPSLNTRHYALTDGK